MKCKLLYNIMKMTTYFCCKYSAVLSYWQLVKTANWCYTSCRVAVSDVLSTSKNWFFDSSLRKSGQLNSGSPPRGWTWLGHTSEPVTWGGCTIMASENKALSGYILSGKSKAGCLYHDIKSFVYTDSLFQCATKSLIKMLNNIEHVLINA